MSDVVNKLTIENLYVLGAEHYKDFEDNFHEIKTKSEKLLWNDLTMFKE